MTVENWAQFFQSHKLFRPLASAEFLRHLGQKGGDKVCVEKIFKPEETIILQGDPAATLYLLGKGRVRVSALGADGKEVDLSTLEAGTFFGELALLGDRIRPRSATVKAATDCVVLQIDAQVFRAALNQHPDIFSEMLLTLCERLRQLAERFAAVAFQEVNNKVQLIGLKLDAELKATNAALAASQTVFQQTTARAHEVIASGEKFWNRVTWVGTTFLGGTTAVLAVLAFFGFRSFYDIQDRAEKATSEIEADAANTKIIAERLERIDESSESMLSGAALVILPTMFEHVRGWYGNATGSNVARKLFSAAIESNNIAVSREVFVSMYKYLLRAGPAPDISQEKFDKLRNILTVATENGDDKNIDPRDIVLSYYITLLSLALDRNDRDFDDKLAALRYYLKKEKPELSYEDQQVLHPHWLQVAIERNKYLDDGVKTDMIKHIGAAWNTVMEP